MGVLIRGGAILCGRTSRGRGLMCGCTSRGCIVWAY